MTDMDGWMDGCMDGWIDNLQLAYLEDVFFFSSDLIIFSPIGLPSNTHYGT